MQISLNEKIVQNKAIKVVVALGLILPVRVKLIIEIRRAAHKTLQVH